MSAVAVRHDTPSSSRGDPSYQRREPEKTLLYRLVAAELDGLREAFAAASTYGSGLPKHVNKELEAFLRCGILAHGFARVVCRRCRAEHFVAWSCKGRGICQSCMTRKMHDSAAHLVDRVLPRVPMRQWVATFSRRVRFHLAADPKLASAALREVLRIVFAWQRERARRVGARPSRANSNGAITFVQRFSSSLELSLHFHVLIQDGVFVRDGNDPDARPRFVEIDPPTSEDVAALLDKIIGRIIALLRRHGRLDGDALDDEPEPHLLLAARPANVKGDAFVDEPLPPRCARKDGFSLHAGIGIHANDRLGLERLCRYGLRPPLAQGRLSEAPDGTLRYEMKRRFSDGRHVLRFEPRDFLMRLCALVPPRGFHMVRYAGIYSAHARGRHKLTGRGIHDQSTCATPPLTLTRARLPPTASASAGGEQQLSVVPPTAAPLANGAAAPIAGTAFPRISKDSGAAAPGAAAPGAAAPGAAAPAGTAAPAGAAAPGAAAPADHLAGPDAPTRQRRLDWAVLMRRTWGIDVLDCPRCATRMTILAVIDDERAARRILEHVGLPSRAPPRGKPWRPQLALRGVHDPPVTYTSFLTTL